MDFKVLCLGSNIGDRHAHLDDACELLESHAVRIQKKSSIYESEPVGFSNQDPFLNQVLLIETALSPEELLMVCLEVEAKMGRERLEKNGPRNIDIDILFYEDQVITQENLLLPHPRISDRRFVLVPLAELIPEEIHPLFDQSIQSLLDTCEDHHWVEKSA